MESYLYRSYIEFQTLSPVFIGGGRELNKKEYIYDRNTGSIYLVDFRKMCEGLQARNLLDAFEAYLMEDVQTQNKKQGTFQNRELFHFLRDNRVPEMIYKNWYIGAVKVADKSMNIRSAKSIQMFMRNAANEPYIPGSSFKGMLRTVLETNYYLENRDKADEMADRIHKASQHVRNKYLNEEDQAIDVQSMHRMIFRSIDNNPKEALKNQNNDTLRGLLIEDSKPISLENMCICEKIDLMVSGKQKRNDIIRECIKPGVRIQIPVTIDSRICPFTMKDILNAIREFNKNYMVQFTKHFHGAPATNGNSTTFYLGGGVGYPSKTVTYGIMNGDEAVKMTAEIIDQTLGNNERNKHKHYLDISKGVSPHMLKCTLYQGRLCQMGACCVM